MPRNLDTNPLSPEETNALAICGSVGFSWRQVADIFDLDPATVRRQFTNQQGDIYKTYLQGRLQKELEIRQAVLTSALNGSSPAQLQMLEFFAAADEENKTL
jgi:hypothetical protein